MSWFAAHLVMYVKFTKHTQERFPVWENVILLRASSEDEAMDRADRRGHEDAAGEDGSFTWGGKPAKWIFAGVRKLTYCDPDKRPDDGAEITYVELLLDSEESVRKFVRGERVAVYFDEKFPECV